MTPNLQDFECVGKKPQGLWKKLKHFEKKLKHFEKKLKHFEKIKTQTF